MKHLLGAVIVVGVLAACGSSDEEPAGGDDAAADDRETGDGDDADSSTEDVSDGGDEASDDSASPNAQTSDDGGDDDTIVIDDFGDIPDECVDLMADFLREIEPAVSGIDWQNVTIDELDAMGSAINAPTDDFDRRSEELGCDRYDIGVDDDQSFEFVLRVAEDAAPGTVGWLQFIADMSAMSDTLDDVTSADDADTSDADGPPADCDGMKEYLLGLADEYGTLTNVPAGEFAAIGVAMGNLTQVCTIAELEAIYDDPAIQAFLDG